MLMQHVAVDDGANLTGGEMLPQGGEVHVVGAAAAAAVADIALIVMQNKELPRCHCLQLR